MSRPIAAPLDLTADDKLGVVIAIELAEMLPEADAAAIDIATGRVTQRAAQRVGMAMLARLSVAQIRQVRKLQEEGEAAAASALVGEAIPNADEVLAASIDAEVASEVAWIGSQEKKPRL